MKKSVVLVLALTSICLVSCGRSIDDKKKMSAAQSSQLTAVGTEENPIATQDSFRILNAGCRSDYTEIEWETTTLSKQVNFRIDLLSPGTSTPITYVEVRCANYQDRCHVMDANTGQEIARAWVMYDNQSNSVKWSFGDNRSRADGSTTDWISATAQGYRPRITVMTGYQAGVSGATIPQCVL